MAKAQVFTNIKQMMTLKGAFKKGGRLIERSDLGLINLAAMVVENGKIVWVGAEKKLPEQFKNLKKIDLKNGYVYPGFVDCHTHMVFAGNRIDEFEKRNQGWSYQQIAESGGGILSTMKATRKASLQELIDSAQVRVERHLSQGVTSVEIKSGYGLNRTTELKMLEAARSLKGIDVVTTYLGAHAIPHGQSEEQYLNSCKKDLDEVVRRKLASRVDIFVEKGYFSVGGARDYLQYAQSKGLQVSVHADQMSRTGASLLAIEVGASSADHVIQLNKKDKLKLAQSNTVAVALPAADFYLQCAYPDVRELIALGGCVALASDYNPGSSPTQNMEMVGLLARLEMKMTLPEVFSAMTVGGARALHLTDRGALKKGLKADFFVSAQPWTEFFYGLSGHQVRQTYRDGRCVFRYKK